MLATYLRIVLAPKLTTMLMVMLMLAPIALSAQEKKADLIKSLETASGQKRSGVLNQLAQISILEGDLAQGE